MASGCERPHDEVEHPHNEVEHPHNEVIGNA